MPITDMNSLYVEELRDLYSGETQLIEALPKVAKAVSSAPLKEAILAHLEETKGQKKRLEQIFKSMEEDPKGETCEAMKGLIEEADELIEMIKDSSVLDAALISAAQKVEHYEMAGYGSVREHAMLLGRSDDADLLTQTLDEESAANSALNKVATTSVNDKAMKAGVGSDTKAKLI